MSIFMMKPPLPSISTSLTVTNPLVLYRTLLALKHIDPDPAQHRLCLELQKIYYRLKDYSPQSEYSSRLSAVSQAVKNIQKHEEDGLAVPGHPIRRNPFFSKLFSNTSTRDNLALTRVLTSHEAAMTLDSPRGFLLHGEVGTGKSMLLDLLADSLPNSKKRRWHFNTFMLETISRLEHLRQSRVAGKDSEYSMIWLAKEMIEKSPILFLDEFQLPDRAASKILSNLFTPFFQLGGVLIASSNRMPDELAKASGMDFSAFSRGGLVRKWFGLKGGGSRSRSPADNEYSQFVDVLKARCDIWDMEGGRDWRRREIEEVDADEMEAAEEMREELIEGFERLEKTRHDNSKTDVLKNYSDDDTKAISPNKYILVSTDEENWRTAIESAFAPGISSPVQWESTTLRVYGRKVDVPKYLDGVTYWTFSNLCAASFGPADYITLASTFHTLILDEVPILTVSQKNEARRLITLLDALYEARCKLIMRAAAGPDGLFFPEIKPSLPSHLKETREANDGGDAVYPETLSEIYQDQTSPFRPNISSYMDEPRSSFSQDEDSDFSPIPGKGNEIGRQVDFGMTSSFTGEDERFAYKRARSRLWEMCGARWHARSEPGWWKPLPLDVRRWERASGDTPVAPRPTNTAGDVKMGESVELDMPAGLQGSKQAHFGERRDPPPNIGETYA